MILRTTYTGNGQSLVEDKRFYPIQSWAQNWRADVSVVLDDAGVQQERVMYSPYGQPFAMPAGDTNFDGDHEAGVDGDELADWDINGVPYRAYADVNLDGDIDGADATAASEHDLGWNVLTSDGGGASGVNNRLGYAGYIHDRDVATAAHVRHRVYKIDLGRWVQTDPAGYVDGASLYQYVLSQPIANSDATGLLAGCVSTDSTAGGCGGSSGSGGNNGESLISKTCKSCCSTSAQQHVQQEIIPAACQGIFAQACERTCRLLNSNCFRGKISGVRAAQGHACSDPSITKPIGPPGPTTRPPDCFIDNNCNKLDLADCYICCTDNCKTEDKSLCQDWCSSPFYVPLGPTRQPFPDLDIFGGGVSRD